MKRYIPIALSLMAFSLISCGEVMDLTQPGKAEVTYSDITLSLYQTGKYELYLDEPEYEYTIMVEKSHCEKEAKAEFAVVDAHSFGEEYTLLPAANYDLDVNSINFKGDDVLHTVGLRFHDLTTLDNTKKYVLGLKLKSDNLAVNEEKSNKSRAVLVIHISSLRPRIWPSSVNISRMGRLPMCVWVQISICKAWIGLLWKPLPPNRWTLMVVDTPLVI